MPWIGVWCEVEEWELAKYADLCRRAGGDRVADLLVRCGKLMAGAGAGVHDLDRMREIEARAAAAVEQKRAAVNRAAAAIVGRLMADGATDGDDAVAKIMAAAGMDGWRGGAGAGTKNGGTARRRRAYGNGTAVNGAGGTVATAEKGKAALNPEETVGRDRRYGESFEGWAAAELRKMGFKMGHVARGIGLDKQSAWRYLSGFAKHWKREGLRGRQFPGPKTGWLERLEECKERALGAGLRGAHVVLNGGGLKGTQLEDPEPGLEPDIAGGGSAEGGEA